MMKDGERAIEQVVRTRQDICRRHGKEESRVVKLPSDNKKSKEPSATRPTPHWDYLLHVALSGYTSLS